MQRIIGEMLGNGVNAGLGLLAGAGIPGVSTAAGVGNWISGAIGFMKTPTNLGKQQLCQVRKQPTAMHIASAPSGVMEDVTVNRSHFLPHLLKGSTMPGSVALGPDVQIKSFERGTDLDVGPGCEGHIESVRVFVGELPINATYGDVIASIPLDLLTGVLKQTKASYIAAEWDMVVWAAASLIYFPTAAATEAGSLIAVSSPDPTRTLGDLSASARVKAAFEYGPDMLASNLWSRGMAMRVALDHERKYQSFKVAVDSDEALKLGGAGRVEVLCSGTWSGSNSPGMLAMDLDFCFLNEVPVAVTAPGPAAGGGVVCHANFHDLSALTTPTWTSGWAGYSNNDFYNHTFSDGNSRLPFGMTTFGGVFNAMNNSAPGQVDAVAGGYVKGGAMLGGGLSAAGWRYLTHDSGSAYVLQVPPGDWDISMKFGCNLADPGAIDVNTVDGGTLVKTTGYNALGPTGREYVIYATMSCGPLSKRLSFTRGTPVANTSSTAMVTFTMTVNRSHAAVTTINPLIDEYAALAIVKSDPLFSGEELDEYVVDAVAYRRDLELKSEVASALVRRGHITTRDFDAYLERVNRLKKKIG